MGPALLTPVKDKQYLFSLSNPVLVLDPNGMYQVCGWCFPGFGKEGKIDGHPVSHGICPKCHAAIKLQISAETTCA